MVYLPDVGLLLFPLNTALTFGLRIEATLPHHEGADTPTGTRGSVDISRPREDRQ